MHFIPFQASVGDSPGDELQQQLVDCLPSGCGEVHLHLPHEIAHKGSSICQGEVSDIFTIHLFFRIFRIFENLEDPSSNFRNFRRAIFEFSNYAIAPLQINIRCL